MFKRYMGLEIERIHRTRGYYMDARQEASRCCENNEISREDCENVLRQRLPGFNDEEIKMAVNAVEIAFARGYDLCVNTEKKYEEFSNKEKRRGHKVAKKCLCMGVDLRYEAEVGKCFPEKDEERSGRDVSMLNAIVLCSLIAEGKREKLMEAAEFAGLVFGSQYAFFGLVDRFLDSVKKDVRAFYAVDSVEKMMNAMGIAIAQCAEQVYGKCVLEKWGKYESHSEPEVIMAFMTGYMPPKGLNFGMKLLHNEWLYESCCEWGAKYYERTRGGY